MPITNLLQLADAICFFETTERFVVGVDYLNFSISYWFVIATTVDCCLPLSCCSRTFLPTSVTSSSTCSDCTQLLSLSVDHLRTPPPYDLVFLYVVTQYGQCDTHLSICQQDILLPSNDLHPLLKRRLGPKNCIWECTVFLF